MLRTRRRPATISLASMNGPSVMPSGGSRSGCRVDLAPKPMRSARSGGLFPYKATESETKLRIGAVVEGRIRV
jgi:hypothetical protein